MPFKYLFYCYIYIHLCILVKGADIGLSGAWEVSEKEKGVAVRKQLQLWEKCLKLRILIQKALHAANELPLPTSTSKTPSEFAQRLKHQHCNNVVPCVEKYLLCILINSAIKFCFEMKEKASNAFLIYSTFQELRSTNKH